MIISKTPLRISFVGGGSDMESFYKNHYGAVISTSIDKYIYINVNKKFDDDIRVSYSKTEIVSDVESVQHSLVRESLKEVDIIKGIEITSIADIPSSGTGLGSSSCYTVGLLNALFAYKDKKVSKNNLSEIACKIEIVKCKEPIGKQDQYACSYGGLNYIRFNRDGTTKVEPIKIHQKNLLKIQNNLLFFYTGITRSTSKILSEQKENVMNNVDKQNMLIKMVEITEDMRKSLNNGNISKFGNYLDLNWQLKKQLSSSISNGDISKWYNIGIKHGALGGKILGAGGGGFLMFYAPKSKHNSIKSSLSFLKPFDIKFEKLGTSIIYNNNEI